MNLKSNLRVPCLVCLWVAMAMAGHSLFAQADDTAAATTNLPVAESAPATVTEPASTNAPDAAGMAAITNAPAAEMAPVATNAPTSATATTDTNTPVAASALTSTNQPAAVAAPAAAAAPVSAKAPPPSQPVSPAPVAATTKMPETEVKRAYQPLNLGAEAGTTGFGGTVGWRFADHFGLVGGMDYLKYSLNKTYSDIPYHGDVQMQSEYAGISYYPSKESSFRINFGAYFNQNQFTGSSISDGTLIVNGFPVPAGTSVNLEYKQQPINPYVSIGGNLYFDKAHHFSLGAELGAFYLGNPRVSVTTNPSGVVPPADLAAYQQQVEDDIKKLPVWPILKLSLNYSF